MAAFFIAASGRNAVHGQEAIKSGGCPESQIMPFKTDANGAIVMDAEKKQLVFVHADGREEPFDVETTAANFSRINGEAKAHRVAKEAAETKLKTFEGIEDGAAALAALATVKNIKEGDLITAGKVQEIKDAAAASAKQAVADATRAAEAREKALTETNTKLTGDLNNHIIGGSFTGSKFIAEKLAIPADIAQKVFGDRFKVESGKLVPMGPDGNPMFSATRHGEHADFEEALQIMVGAYPNKDMILKGSGASGGGASGGAAGAAGGKTMSRAQFDAAPAATKAEFAKTGGTVTE